MKRFGVIVLLFASVAPSRAYARRVKEELAKFIRVEMKNVRTHPYAFLDKLVTFDAYFAGLGSLYRPFNTPFIKDHYVNFRAWDVGSKLWLKQAREDAFVSLYCPRSKRNLTDFLQSLDVLSAVRIYGRVMVVYGGYPWVEVDRILPGRAQTYTEKSLKHIGLGMARLDAKDYVLAGRSFKKALAEGMPRNAKALVSRHLGEAHYRLGRYAEAEKALAMSLDILSEAGQPDPVLYMRLGQTHNELGRPQRALEELKKAIDVEPSLAEAHAALGLALGKLKRYREGLMANDTALKLKVLPVAHRNKAMIYLLMGNTGLAIRAYKDAIMARATWPLPHKELGDVYMRLERYEKAEETYTSLVYLRPQKAQGYVLRAKARLAQKIGEKTKGAIEDYEKAVDVEAQHIPGYLGLAEIYVKLKRPDEALRHLEEAVRVDPQHVEAHMRCGEVLEMLRKLNEAAEEYAKACALRPEDVSARLRHAIALWNKSEPDWNAAISELETAIASEPQNQKILRTLGRFYSEVGRFGEALDRLRNAKRQKEDEITTRLWLAETLRRLGDDSAALKELRGVEKLAPKDMMAKAMHAMILASRMRRLNRATELAEEAFRSDRKNPDFLDTLAFVLYKSGGGARAVGLLLEAAKTSKSPDVFYHLALALHEVRNPLDARKYIKKAAELLKGLPAEGAGRKRLGREIARLKVRIEREYREYVKKHGMFAPEEEGMPEAKEGYVPIAIDAPTPPGSETP